MITKERLTELADKNTICEVSHEERVALATELLELRQQLGAENPKQEGGWIEWSGGERPCDYRSVVEVRLRSGYERRAGALSWEWKHHNSIWDIVAYRVVI